MIEIAEASISQAQQHFVAMMPEIQDSAALTFRHLDPESREDALAETLAMSWQNFLHCTVEHKPVAACSLSHYAMLSVKSGRSLCGQNSTDVLSCRTRLLGRSHVQSLNTVLSGESASSDSDYQGGWWDATEALVDRRVWECPPERVRLRHDYGKFLRSRELTPQEKTVFTLIALGHLTGEIAGKLQVSAPRVCQVKDSLGKKLAEFMGPDICPVFRGDRGLDGRAMCAR